MQQCIGQTDMNITAYDSWAFGWIPLFPGRLWARSEQATATKKSLLEGEVATVCSHTLTKTQGMVLCRGLNVAAILCAADARYCLVRGSNVRVTGQANGRLIVKPLS